MRSFGIAKYKQFTTISQSNSYFASLTLRFGTFVFRSFFTFENFNADNFLILKLEEIFFFKYLFLCKFYFRNPLTIKG